MYSVGTESSSILKYHQEIRINSNQEIRRVRETEKSGYKKRLKLLSEDQKSLYFCTIMSKTCGYSLDGLTWLKPECDGDQGIPLNFLIFLLVFQ